jgi:peptidoglycan-associated lipoprotein
MKWRDTMYGKTFKSSAVVVIGTVLIFGQGCSSKWWQSDGDMADSQIPRISGGGSSGSSGSGGELSGFSQNPSEERLQAGGGLASVSSGMSERQRAELTKEEKAAIEAGLQDVFFAYDQWTLSDAGMNALNRNAAWLKAHPGAVMKVEGHCDERGTGEYNLVLGEKRAKAARSYLVDMGVSSKQLGVVSYGKERPFCAEHDETCYQQNRRGHMLLSVKK